MGEKNIALHDLLFRAPDAEPGRRGAFRAAVRLGMRAQLRFTWRSLMDCAKTGDAGFRRGFGKEKPLRGKTKAVMNYRTPKDATFNGVDWQETGSLTPYCLGPPTSYNRGEAGGNAPVWGRIEERTERRLSRYVAHATRARNVL